MRLQLRIYTIAPGFLDEFAREWKTLIKPLRLKIGCNVPGAWTIRETGQFIWILGYDGPLTWEEMDRTYFDSPERRSMTPDPARHIAGIEQFFMDPVP